MKLADFIATHMDEITAEFVSFASTLRPAAIDFSSVQLRDHACEILSTIASDLNSAQTPKQKKEKSIGQVSVMIGAATPASTHGAGRQASGFTLPQLTAEYRALRASVLRLWMPDIRSVTRATAADIARFHEGMDQALQESVIQYAQKTDRARDTFLAILGHDLRSPLATMAMAGMFLTREGEGTERTAQIGVRVKRSAAAMTTMVNDLLEYARTELGGKIGLFIAREITVAHGGTIRAESSARSGTVFTVQLPRSLDLRGDRSRGR